MRRVPKLSLTVQRTTVNRFRPANRVQDDRADSGEDLRTGQGGDPLGHIENLRWIPDQASAEKLYDNFDFQNAVQAYLLSIPAIAYFL
jgi:hypothetical protein